MLIDEINSIIDDFFELSKDSIRYLALNKNSMQVFSSFIKQDCIVVDLLNPQVKISPISPFMSLLKEQNLSREQIHPYTYSLQESCFASYFETGDSGFRNDIIIIEEIVVLIAIS